MGVCLFVKPDVSVCKSVSSENPFGLLPIAHNSDLIKNRNLNTYTNTQEGTLYPADFTLVLVCL